MTRTAGITFLNGSTLRPTLFLDANSRDRKELANGCELANRFKHHDMYKAVLLLAHNRSHNTHMDITVTLNEHTVCCSSLICKGADVLELFTLLFIQSLGKCLVPCGITTLDI